MTPFRTFARIPFRAAAACMALFIILTSNKAAMAGDPFEMGWYSNVFGQDPSQAIADMGGSVALYYHQGYLADSTVKKRLDAAYAKGLKVIMNVDGVTQVGSDVTAVNTIRIQQFVNTFKSHPAVIGWYTADEPVGNTQLSLCIQAYNAVKGADPDRPVYLAIHRSSDNTVVDYAPAYDVLIYDTYPYSNDSSEFYRLEDRGFMGSQKGLKSQINRVSNMATQTNKPWIFAGQGFGRAPNMGSRLPTTGEHRFQTYYPLIKGSEGFLAWEYTTALNSAANAGDPYPHAGSQWLNDVYKPLAEEIAIIGPALGNGWNAADVSDSIAAVHSRIYTDPNNARRYLLALNEVDNAYNVTFNIALQGDWMAARPLDGRPDIPITAGQFSDQFSRYNVSVYELVAVPEPGACAVLMTAFTMVAARRPAK